MKKCERNIKNRIYICTFSESAEDLIKRNGLGAEIDEFCIADNLEGICREEMCADICRKYEGIDRIMHGPFNELFPSAIDNKIRAIARERMEEAYEIAVETGMRKMVVHSGFYPTMYWPQWHVPESIKFWKDFMRDKDILLCIENVFEMEPYIIGDVVKGIDMDNVKICFDTGHAAYNSEISVIDWLKELGPWISHIHIHNNDGDFDTHKPLGKGKIDFEEVLDYIISELNDDVTITIESHNAEECIDWLEERGYIK